MELYFFIRDYNKEQNDDYPNWSLVHKVSNDLYKVALCVNFDTLGCVKILSVSGLLLDFHTSRYQINDYPN